nr:uncharacterized protein LOC129431469 isoform X1 [Misgurnus anguillicaudatus]
MGWRLRSRLLRPRRHHPLSKIKQTLRRSSALLCLNFHLLRDICFLPPLVAVFGVRLRLHRMRWSRRQRGPNLKGCRLVSRLLRPRRHHPLSKIKQTLPWPTVLQFLNLQLITVGQSGKCLLPPLFLNVVLLSVPLHPLHRKHLKAWYQTPRDPDLMGYFKKKERRRRRRDPTSPPQTPSRK